MVEISQGRALRALLLGVLMVFEAIKHSLVYLVGQLDASQPSQLVNLKHELLVHNWVDCTSVNPEFPCSIGIHRLRLVNALAYFFFDN